MFLHANADADTTATALETNKADVWPSRGLAGSSFSRPTFKFPSNRQGTVRPSPQLASGCSFGSHTFRGFAGSRWEAIF